MLHVALLLVSLSPTICADKENYNSLPLLTTKEDYELLFIVLLTKLVNSTQLGGDHSESNSVFNKHVEQNSTFKVWTKYSVMANLHFEPHITDRLYSK